MWKKLAIFVLGAVMAAGAESFPYDRPVVKTLESHGPSAGRLDLVFVSDGYTMTVSRFEEASRVAQKAPGCDIVIVMSTLTGLSHGGSQTTLTARDTGAFPHELGHTLGKLGDEYNSPTRQADRETFTMPRSGDLEYPNLTLPAFCDVSTPEKMAKTIKWGHLLSLPDAKDVVGAYPGGYYRMDGVFRPSYTCTMRDGAYSTPSRS